MIDVHILTMPNEDSTDVVNSMKGQPVNIMPFPGIDGEMFKARAIAYRSATSEFVSCVDPDDLVLPEAYSKITEYLEANPDCDAVYTNSYGKRDRPMFRFKELNMDAVKRSNQVYIHQVYVVRTALMLKVLDIIEKENYLPAHYFSDQLILTLIASMTKFHFMHELFGYKYSGITNMRSEDRKLAYSQLAVSRQRIFNNGA